MPTSSRRPPARISARREATGWVERSPRTSERMPQAMSNTDATRDLLFRMADDSLIIAHRNSEWTGIGPILEEDIAFSSIAQDKMGHAQALYDILHSLGEAEPDTLAFTR